MITGYKTLIGAVLVVVARYFLPDASDEVLRTSAQEVVEAVGAVIVLWGLYDKGKRERAREGL